MCHQCGEFFNPNVMDWMSVKQFWPNIFRPIVVEVVVEATCYEAFKVAEARRKSTW